MWLERSSDLHEDPVSGDKEGVVDKNNPITKDFLKQFPDIKEEDLMNPKSAQWDKYVDTIANMVRDYWRTLGVNIFWQVDNLIADKNQTSYDIAKQLHVLYHGLRAEQVRRYREEKPTVPKID